MITRNNLLTEYPAIDQSILPNALQQEEFTFISDNIDLVDDDEDIRKFVDTFIEKLNEVLEKQQTQVVPAKADKLPVKQPKGKAKQPKERKEKTAKPKQEPKPKKQKPETPRVEQMPVEIALLKSFYNMHGKVKTKTQVYFAVKKLQKAITGKAVRKTSPYASQIEFMQKFLVYLYNNMKSGHKTLEIPSERLADLKKIVNMKLADHVLVIRAFINILNDTKTGLMDKAKALFEKISKSTFDDAAKPAIEKVKKSLADYIYGGKETIRINEFDLQGLYGLAGLSGLGNPPVATTPTNDNKVMSAADFKNTSFKLMGFTGKWLQLIGDPSVPFKAMIWGTGGSGKSTLAIEFARYLAGTLNKRVLYIANEEGAGATLHEKMTRLNAFHPNLFITKTLPPRLVEYDFVFCDSANSMQMELTKFEQTVKLYPRLSWVLLFQTTKDGKFLGEKNWQHAVDVEVYCDDGKARALKSRFGGKEMIQIY